jgi:hypothetical protein
MRTSKAATVANILALLAPNQPVRLYSHYAGQFDIEYPKSLMKKICNCGLGADVLYERVYELIDTNEGTEIHCDIWN